MALHWILHDPSAWRQEVPKADSVLPPIVTVCWYSRQNCPDANWYVRVGVTDPELPESGLFHVALTPVLFVSSA